jgi:hypothetical protein
MTGPRPEKKLPRIVLTGGEEGQKRPDLVVALFSERQEMLSSYPVTADGTFEIPPARLKEAHRIVIGPVTRDPKNLFRVGLRLRREDYLDLIKRGDISVAPGLWQDWFRVTRCVSGAVRLCRRPTWWFNELSIAALPPRNVMSFAPSVVRPVTELLALPFRCETICNGTVEVYRRTCCGTDWIIDDPRIPELIRELEEVIRVIPEFPPIRGPFPEPRPGPGPDPLPFISEPQFVRDGTLDEFAINAGADLAALRRLKGPAVVAYIAARPYLRFRRWSCGAPALVASGTINPDGRFNICWRDFVRLLRVGCKEEFAYVVRQTIGGVTYTIYNGVLVNQWYAAGENPTLTSHSRYAFACRDNGEPGTGAFVYLDTIGGMQSHRLATPASTGWDRVAAPAYNSGLADPAPTPADAVGALLDRNWGGTLPLNIMFSEDLKDAAVGARYYRVSVTAATPTGAPTGTRHYLGAGLSWTKAVSTPAGTEIVPEVLGPFSLGGHDALYKIPYDSEWNWGAGQYHAYLDTTDPRWNDPLTRHLITIEIFDGAGQRLRPAGTAPVDPADAGLTKPFFFRRWRVPTGLMDNVPHAALTHMFWWDNRPLTAELLGFTVNGSVSTAQCLFLAGPAGTQFGVQYRAFHPNPMFKHYHDISWIRGRSDPAEGGLLESHNATNVTVPTLSATDSFANLLGTFMAPDPTGTVRPVQRDRCAFAVTLFLQGKTTDGSGVPPHVSHTGAVALLIG